eukprot:c10953_g1_i1 orf=402-794(-)
MIACTSTKRDKALLIQLLDHANYTRYCQISSTTCSTTLFSNMVVSIDLEPRRNMKITKIQLLKDQRIKECKAALAITALQSKICSPLINHEHSLLYTRNHIQVVLVQTLSTNRTVAQNVIATVISSFKRM